MKTRADNSAPRLADVAAEQYGNRLHRFLLRRMGPNAAEDVVQEVYVRLLQVPLLEFVRDPERYIFTVARHVAGDFARREQRQRSALRIDSEEIDRLDENPEQLGLDETAHWVSSGELLQSFFEQLPPEQQAALLLHLEGHSFVQIAQRLEVSARAAKRYVEKARERLRQILEGPT